MRRLTAALLCLPLVLAACGDDAADDTTATESTATSSASPSAAATSTEAPAEGLPTVTGEFGEKPTIAAPEGAPPAELQTEVLTKGDGATVEAGDLLVANYLGQTWREDKVFDNSYDRGSPTGFPIGVGQVVQGWDEALVGQTVGSRVLMTIPPELGYGTEGNPQAGIEGDDTLVFVVDIVDRFGKGVSASGTPVDDVPEGLPTVEGGPGEKPTLTLGEGAEPPAEPTSALLIEGDGEPIGESKNLVIQVVQGDYESGETSFNTWDTAPISVQAQQLPGLAEALEGQNVGSRVLLALPAGENGQPAAAFVIDVVGTF